MDVRKISQKHLSTMSESSGSTLQLQSRATILSKVNLLIVSPQPSNFQEITSRLCAAKVDFTYDLIDTEQLNHYSLEQKYSAIIYEHITTAQSTATNFLIERLQFWTNLYPATPLILLTDALGDEQAIKLIQYGVSGYVLRDKLQLLPETLERSLFNFASQRAIVQQQQALIDRQQRQIQQLTAEKQSWQEQQNTAQEHIAHLAHELRNPIAAIIGFGRALKEEYYGELNPKQQQYAGLLLDSGEHLLALVKNYLEITKIDADKQVLELERIAIVEICQASILMVEDKASAKGLKLNFDLEAHLDFCTADSMRLKQILINLLSNAIKFTDRGSVTLKVGIKESYIYFAVIDTGMGISSENITKLFKPFPQISNHHENTGLGLTLSKKLAQLHGGDITVTSELGKGSCFTLLLPDYESIAFGNC